MPSGEYHWHPTPWRRGDECWTVTVDAALRYQPQLYARVLSVGPVGMRLRRYDGREERVRFEHAGRLWRSREGAERFAVEHVGPPGTTAGMMGTPGNGLARAK